MYTYIHMYACVCVYLYIYIYTCMHTYQTNTISAQLKQTTT